MAREKQTAGGGRGIGPNPYINKVDTGSLALNVVARAMETAAQTNAQAAERANAISERAQQNAMDFNERMAYWQAGQNWAMMNAANAFQAQQAQQANDFSALMWNNTAQFNAEQQAEAMNFNSAEAERNRQWQEHMSNTSYQRAVADLRAAGLNPVLALMKGGASVGSGANASISPTSIGSISGQQAAGKMGSVSGTSVGGFSGILENTSNELALLGAAVTGISTAWEAFKEYETQHGNTVKQAGKDFATEMLVPGGKRSVIVNGLLKLFGKLNNYLLQK